LRDVVRLTEPPEIITTVAAGSPPLVNAVTIVRGRGVLLSAAAIACPKRCAGNLVPATHGLSTSEDLRNLKPAQIALVNSEIAARRRGKNVPGSG